MQQRRQPAADGGRGGYGGPGRGGRLLEQQLQAAADGGRGGYGYLMRRRPVQQLLSSRRQRRIRKDLDVVRPGSSTQQPMAEEDMEDLDVGGDPGAAAALLRRWQRRIPE
ncbi:hypothetical protein TNCT_247131 [Trichonephila clavata]|uniref:Uncharacterized protein n=1 Tax=Trichonephila clavata TaxID=2740835 RepID=A0A8X6H8B5_TRICU|nr:hypothetical protein TNCT_247131 [Trichonephila clavata]